MSRKMTNEELLFLWNMFECESYLFPGEASHYKSCIIEQESCEWFELYLKYRGYSVPIDYGKVILNDRR